MVFAIAEKGYRQKFAAPPEVEDLMKDIQTHYSELHSTSEVIGYMGRESDSDST